MSVHICKEGARTGSLVLTMGVDFARGLPAERLQLWVAVVSTVSSQCATGLEFASSTLPMRRVALVLVSGKFNLRKSELSFGSVKASRCLLQQKETSKF